MTHAPLEPAGDGIWTTPRPLRMLGIEVGTRMTVAEIDGDLWVCSPVALTPALQQALDELGRVRWVVAPNRYHHLYVGDFAEAYPDAELVCPPGLTTKRRDVSWSQTADDDATWGAVQTVRVGGMPLLDELVFLHPPSRSLIVADLLMNARETGHRFTDIVLKLDGVLTGRPEFSRLFRAFAIRNRAALTASIDRILDWDFDRLVVCHGDNVESGAKDHAARVLGRLRS